MKNTFFCFSWHLSQCYVQWQSGWRRGARIHLMWRLRDAATDWWFFILRLVQTVTLLVLFAICLLFISHKRFLKLPAFSHSLSWLGRCCREGPVCPAGTWTLPEAHRFGSSFAMKGVAAAGFGSQKFSCDGRLQEPKIFANEAVHIQRPECEHRNLAVRQSF